MASSERNARTDGAPADSAAGGATSRTAESAESLLDQLRRERADFLNYKRRAQRERAEVGAGARDDVLRELIPFLDDLDRALSRIPPALESDPWVQGVALGRHRLLDALSRLGVQRFGAEGEPFDAALHEAQFFDERPGATDRRIGQVLQPGYRLGDRLLRPAQVSVVGPAEHRDGRAPTDTDHDRPSTPGGRSPRNHNDVRAGG
jgi:molecular chaperone GrpE